MPFYQPKVALDTKRMCGAEALVRWIHKGKILSPAEFLPSLERAGEIHDLDIKEQTIFVKNVHCNVIQGFYFDKPMPVAEFEQRLRKKVYDSETFNDHVIMVKEK